jgi:anion-transporting  ArsA/GET3 family ATPase
MLVELLKTKSAIVCVGSGGVGKTTTAAALGLQAAEMGRKAVVLTVDPARRLATTLGLSTSTSQEVQVCSTASGGELWASLIHPREIFDEFIRGCASNEAEAQRLIQNRLYQQLATRLSGSQEFTSLEKLYQLKTKQNFDIIILDTPPAQNAVDFLLAPDRLLNLFQDSITKWFIGGTEEKSLWRSLIGFGTMKALKSLEFLTGAGFIQELMDFFAAMRSFQRQIGEHAVTVQAVLRQPSTSFVLVTGFEAAKLSEAEQVTLDLKGMGFLLSTVIINRAHPQWLKAVPSANDVAQLPEDWANFFKETKSYYEGRLALYQKFAQTQNKDCEVLLVPQFHESAMSGLDGLRALYSALERGSQ